MNDAYCTHKWRGFKAKTLDASNHVYGITDVCLRDGCACEEGWYLPGMPGSRFRVGQGPWSEECPPCPAKPEA